MLLHVLQMYIFFYYFFYFLLCEYTTPLQYHFSILRFEVTCIYTNCQYIFYSYDQICTIKNAYALVISLFTHSYYDNFYVTQTFMIKTIIGRFRTI